MALPRVNESSWYELQIPSTKQDVTFRPFLVKEQKILLIASESQDKKQIIQAMMDTITSCIREPIKIDELASFDIDYLFSKIRSKSVGETSNIIVNCTQCSHGNDVSVNVNDAAIVGDIKPSTIELTSDISIEMRYPTYRKMMSNSSILSDDADQTKVMFEILSTCIEAVVSSEERISLADESKEEIDTFIESLTTEQFTKITEFVQNMPKLTYSTQVTCTECGHVNDLTLSGLEDFF